MGGPIIFNIIDVFGQQQDSAVAVGDNNQNGWNAHQKLNNMGSLNGINITLYTINHVNDMDFADAIIIDRDISSSAQV